MHGLTKVTKFLEAVLQDPYEIKKTKGREPLGVYKDILDQMARADQEVDS